MPFDPAGFLETARSLLDGQPDEADIRTACGRAYYAAYGTMRRRLCEAKGVSPDRLFGKTGRHGDLVNAIWRSPRLRNVGAQYQRLLSKRVQSDYKSDSEVRRADAEIALQDATWVVAQLVKIRDRDFQSFPLVSRD